jgi:hypothetical protein
MSEEKLASHRLDRVRELMREWEAEPQSFDPDLARTYPGEWVVIHRGQVVAHGKTGSALVQAGHVHKHPGARPIYVPTLEQQEGIWLLPIAEFDKRLYFRFRDPTVLREYA